MTYVDGRSHIPIISLINTYIEEGSLGVTVYVQNDFKKSMVEQDIERIRDYFKCDVFIVVKPDVFQVEEVSVAKRTVERKGVLLGKLLNAAFIEDPYFVGKSNELVYSAVESMLNGLSNANIAFFYGGIGTGKTHLMEVTAHRAFKSGKVVYYNSSERFIEEMKLYMDNKETDFFSNVQNIDFLLLDDFFFFNRTHLEGFYDILYSSINALVFAGKKAFFASDVPPEMLSNLPKRIVSRLLSGYKLKFDLPSEDIKRQCIEYFSRKNGMQIEKDIVDIILLSSNLREVKGYLNICQFLWQKGVLSKQSFVELAALHTGDRQNLSIKSVTSELREVLREYWGVGQVDATSGKRKPRSTALIDSIVYYLCLENGENKQRLMRELNILPKHHTYYYRKGKQNYEELQDEWLKHKLREIMSRKLDVMTKFM